MGLDWDNRDWNTSRLADCDHQGMELSGSWLYLKSVSCWILLEWKIPVPVGKLARDDADVSVIMANRETQTNMYIRIMLRVLQALARAAGAPTR